MFFINISFGAERTLSFKESPCSQTRSWFSRAGFFYSDKFLSADNKKFHINIAYSANISYNKYNDEIFSEGQV